MMHLKRNGEYRHNDGYNYAQKLHHRLTQRLNQSQILSLSPSLSEKRQFFPLLLIPLLSSSSP